MRVNNNIFFNPPKAVWVTSSPMTEFQREFMQNIFKAPVYSQYGSVETFWLAAECQERKGMHMFSDIRHIEFVNEFGKNVEIESYGNILVTDLEDYLFPIIRYQNIYLYIFSTSLHMQHGPLLM